MGFRLLSQRIGKHIREELQIEFEQIRRDCDELAEKVAQMETRVDEMSSQLQMRPSEVTLSCVSYYSISSFFLSFQVE